MLHFVQLHVTTFYTVHQTANEITSLGPASLIYNESVNILQQRAFTTLSFFWVKKHRTDVLHWGVPQGICMVPAAFLAWFNETLSSTLLFIKCQMSPMRKVYRPCIIWNLITTDVWGRKKGETARAASLAVYASHLIPLVMLCCILPSAHWGFASDYPVLLLDYTRWKRNWHFPTNH